MQAIETHRTTLMVRVGRKQSDPLAVAHMILLGPI
jgi:hypothetical protein